MISPKPPGYKPPRRSIRERLRDWWHWTVIERWLDFRWHLGDRLEQLSYWVKP